MLLSAPFQGLAGGATIGLGAASLLLFNGEIMGASGIVSSAAILTPRQTFQDATKHWKFALLSGFALTSQFLLLPMIDFPDTSLEISSLRYVVGGILVGFGTKLGNGCTSGHGICGLARFSKRSLAAVLSFMASAIFTTVANPPKLATTEMAPAVWSEAGRVLALVITGAAVVAPQLYPSKIREYKSLVSAALSGVLFSTGLALSGMIFPVKIYGFLDISGMVDGSWDPTLVLVMCGGLASSFLGYLAKNGRTKPVCTTDFHVPTSATIDSNLVLGAACFGVGWGTAFLCPGPAFFHAVAGVQPVLTLWWPSYAVGVHLANKYKGQ